MSSSHHVSHIMCHMSGVTCQVSLVTCHASRVTCHIIIIIIFFLFKEVELVDGGSVNNGVYPIYLLYYLKNNLFKTTTITLLNFGIIFLTTTIDGIFFVRNRQEKNGAVPYRFVFNMLFITLNVYIKIKKNMVRLF